MEKTSIAVAPKPFINLPIFPDPGDAPRTGNCDDMNFTLLSNFPDCLAGGVPGAEDLVFPTVLWT